MSRALVFVWRGSFSSLSKDLFGMFLGEILDCHSACLHSGVSAGSCKLLRKSDQVLEGFLQSHPREGEYYSLVLHATVSGIVRRY